MMENFYSLYQNHWMSTTLHGAALFQEVDESEGAPWSSGSTGPTRPGCGDLVTLWLFKASWHLVDDDDDDDDDIYR